MRNLTEIVEGQDLVTKEYIDDCGYITSYTDEKLKVAVDDENQLYPVLTSSSTIAGTKKYSNLLNFTTYGSAKCLAIGGTASDSTKKAGALRIFNDAGGSVTLQFDSTATYSRGIIIPNKAGSNVTLATLQDIPSIPTNVSAFTNDAGYTTNTGTITKVQTTAGAHSTINISSGAASFNVPTKTSHLTNDSGYLTGITSSQVTTALGYTPYNSTNPNGYTSNTGTVTKVTAGTGLSIGTTAGGNFTTTGTINHTNSVTAQTTQAVYPIKIDAQGHISGYGSAVTIPTVPTNVSAFTNDAGYLTSYTETDPVFGASAAAEITSTDITNWDAKIAGASLSGTYDSTTKNLTLSITTS